MVFPEGLRLKQLIGVTMFSREVAGLSDGRWTRVGWAPNTVDAVEDPEMGKCNPTEWCIVVFHFQFSFFLLCKKLDWNLRLLSFFLHVALCIPVHSFDWAAAQDAFTL